MKIKMKISYWLYVAFMPYVLLILAVVLFKPLGSKELAPYIIVMVTLSCLLNIICMINIGLGIVHTLRKGNCRGAAGRNIFVKFIHIPVYLGLLLLCAGFMNPWLVVATIIPIGCACGLMMYTGVMNIAGCLKLSREHRTSVGLAVFLGVCGFLPILDLIFSIVQYVFSFRKSFDNIYN